MPLGLTACIGGGTTKAEFIAQGDEICRSFEQGAGQLTPQADPFSSDTSSEDLQQASALLQYFATQLPKLADGLNDLGVPEEGAAPARQAMRLMKETAGNFAQAKATLDSGDVATAKQQAEMAFGRLERAGALAQQYGFKVCGAVNRPPQDPNLSPADTEIEVRAIDYSFIVPATLGAGPANFVIRNEGKERHELTLVRLKADASAEQVLNATRSGEDTAALIEKEIGASSPASPGETTSFGVVLEPGRYGYACFIVAPDGEPHAYKGMAGQFDVG